MDISLTLGKISVIDDSDEALVKGYSWCAHRTPVGKWYARTSIFIQGKKKWLWLHRLILGVKDSRIVVDHKDGDGLNNRRKNIRPSSHVNNSRNRMPRPHSSKFKGVSWRKNRKQWYAQIELTGRKHVFLGSFPTEKQAANAYDEAARKYFGEHARTNAGE